MKNHRITKLKRYWHTIRYLRPIQIYGRLKLYIKKTSIDLSPKFDLNDILYEWTEAVRNKKSMTNKSTFMFLNESGYIQSSDDWNEGTHSKLWFYNLHYFDDLCANNSHQRNDWHREMIEKWITDNPVGVGIGWDPYPLSRRIVNIIKWSLAGNNLEKHWNESLLFQTRYLEKNIEIHIMGNHLFSNAKALYFAGLYFSGKEANRWRKKGENIIRRELREQILRDGGNFELSTMYHSIFLVDLLDIYNISRAFKKKLHLKIKDYIFQMYKWMKVMVHPDKEISFFNDAALCIAPSPDEITKYCKRLLGPKNFDELDSEINSKNLIELSESGYTKICIGKISIILDRASIGPDYLPGHAHADTLSFELSHEQQRVIVNSGTSVYQDEKRRYIERSTSSHSTIEIDGKSSSQIWGNFRVAKRAKIINSHTEKNDKLIKVSGCHDGYKRIGGSPIHCREWLIVGNTLTITDRISGTGIHSIKNILPLHPAIKVNQKSQNKVALECKGNNILSIEFGDHGRLEVQNSLYNPEFGLSIGNKKILYSYLTKLPIKTYTRISW